MPGRVAEVRLVFSGVFHRMLMVNRNRWVVHRNRWVVCRFMVHWFRVNGRIFGVHPKYFLQTASALPGRGIPFEPVVRHLVAMEGTLQQLLLKHGRSDSLVMGDGLVMVVSDQVAQMAGVSLDPVPERTPIHVAVKVAQE